VTTCSEVVLSGKVSDKILSCHSWTDVHWVSSQTACL